VAVAAASAAPRRGWGGARQAYARGRVLPVQLHVHALSAHRVATLHTIAENAAEARHGEVIWWSEHANLWDHTPQAEERLASPESLIRRLTRQDERLADGEQWKTYDENVYIPASSHPILKWMTDGPGTVQVHHLLGVEEVDAEDGEFQLTGPADNVLMGVVPVGCNLSDLRIEYGRTRDESYAAYEAALAPGQFAGLEYREFDSGDALPHNNLYLPQAGLQPAGMEAREEIIAWAQAQGGLVSYNHPFWRNSQGWEDRVDRVFEEIEAERALGCQTIELHEECFKAKLRDHLELWDRLVAAGMPLFATMVSDAHQPSAFAERQGLTWLLSAEAERAVMITRLRNGRFFCGFKDRYKGGAFSYRIAGVPMARTGKADWGQGIVCGLRGYRLRLTQFDESGYLVWRGPLSALQERASWARLEAHVDQGPALIGQWCRLL
jgi:hypothetical protein